MTQVLYLLLPFLQYPARCQQTKEMLDLARKNAVEGNYQNVTFIASTLQSVPLPSATADVLTSNCVINLLATSEKPGAFAEIFRLLKPGGRVAVSDVLALAPLPEDVREDSMLYVGCVAGASLVREYESWMAEAGFQGSPSSPSDPRAAALILAPDVSVVNTNKNLNIYKDGILAGPAPATGCCGTAVPARPGNKALEYDLNEFVGEFAVTHSEGKGSAEI
jgi:SAM-dependent methyltransferase